MSFLHKLASAVRGRPAPAGVGTPLPSLGRQVHLCCHGGGGGESDCCPAIPSPQVAAPAASPRAETKVWGGWAAHAPRQQFSQGPRVPRVQQYVRVYCTLWILESTLSLYFMDLNMYSFASFHGF